MSSGFPDWPSGLRFCPTDDELLSYLQDKVRKDDFPRYLFSDDENVYEKAPWSLRWDRSNDKYFHGNARFFFVRRKPFSGKDNPVRMKRSVDSGEGWWRSNSRDKPIMDKQGSGTTIGFVRSLTFFVEEKGKRERSRRQEATKKDWIMHEYTLAGMNVEDWVLCKIRCKEKQPSVMPSDASTSTIHPPPQSQYCAGPDRQLPQLSAQEGHWQEPHAPSSEGVAGRVVEETLAVDSMEMDGSLPQQRVERPQEECNREYARSKSAEDLERFLKEIEMESENP